MVCVPTMLMQRKHSPKLVVAVLSKTKPILWKLCVVKIAKSLRKGMTKTKLVGVLYADLLDGITISVPTEKGEGENENNP